MLKIGKLLIQFYIIHMSNYPPGAENDPRAPYNEPLPKEEVLDFELKTKGKVFIQYNSEEELEERINDFRKELDLLINRLGIMEEIKVETLFSEVW